ncbi:MULTISPECIES: metal-dependent hydrolase [Nitrosomonas]|uniref:metal-dependent hydrolase n=2 Tax=Nitrosomonadaceae TaxID=206379 RepID=UPI000794B9DE|nr:MULTISPECIES: metal-dependent hydrolase [Nitrosomonas]HRQ05610.1 metal-dependent hydrolase [Nitrosomonas halophila]KXK48055.1 MAG: membrane-bound metal-dependent hydrolase [Nitrosomonas europaea]QOJ09596.1 MAG: metal-dependent hydrolase [Nitrosomonas sp. H1_AOB3]HRN82802.1 metal-dependent hydrolase [Nitrosomonas europaea]HRO56150.1 metal-dependent hydrolase [Nitrosomonas europaea]
MDPVTHTLSGALLMRAVTSSHTQHAQQLPLRERIIAGSLAAVFPDSDVILRLVDTLTYLNWHQGPTHSLVMLPFWAFLLAHLFSGFSGRRYPWRSFFVPACLGILIHILGDLVTAYGLMLLAPFSTWRFSLPLVFVIDPWFTAIILAGLVLSAIFPAKRVYAVASLIGVVAYVAFLWMLHQEAMQAGKVYATGKMLDPQAVSVLPQPLSPFNQMVIIREGTSLHVARINLRRNVLLECTDSGNPLCDMAAAYHPLAMANWRSYGLYDNRSPAYAALSHEAWQQPVLAPFRQFAQFPVLDGIDHSAQNVCVWFIDLRFQFPGLPPSFRYGVCRETGNSSWYLQRQRGAFWID